MVRPTIIASTPRLWTILYNQYLQALHEAYVEQQRKEPDSPSADSPSSELADNSKDRGLETVLEVKRDALPPYDIKHFDVETVPADLQREVMGRFKSKLGGREKMITTGGAPTGKRVKRFIIDCFEGMVNEGYGSTEVYIICYMHDITLYPECMTEK